MKYIKEHLLPIIIILAGILDSSTDLLMTLLEQINAPEYAATLVRIVVISIGAIKLYLSNPNKLNDAQS
jgi:hypothetical protein